MKDELCEKIDEIVKACEKDGDVTTLPDTYRVPTKEEFFEWTKRYSVTEKGIIPTQDN